MVDFFSQEKIPDMKINYVRNNNFWDRLDPFFSVVFWQCDHSAHPNDVYECFSLLVFQTGGQFIGVPGFDLYKAGVMPVGVPVQAYNNAVALNHRVENYSYVVIDVSTTSMASAIASLYTEFKYMPFFYPPASDWENLYLDTRKVTENEFGQPLAYSLNLDEKYPKNLSRWLARQQRALNNTPIQYQNVSVDIQPESIVESKVSWFMGNYPVTPHLSMRFFDGLSYYISNGLVINIELTRSIMYNKKYPNFFVLSHQLDIFGRGMRAKFIVMVPAQKVVAYDKGYEFPESDFLLAERQLEKFKNQNRVGLIVYNKEQYLNLSAKTEKFDIFKTYLLSGIVIGGKIL